MQSRKETLYELLGVSKSASPDELTKAYHNKARAMHPDKHPNQTESEIDRYKDVVDAYEILKDKDKRKIYDLSLENGNPNFFNYNYNDTKKDSYTDPFSNEKDFSKYYAYHKERFKREQERFKRQQQEKRQKRIDKRGTINFDIRDPNNTDLHFAIYNCEDERAKILVKDGADIHAKNSSGVSAVTLIFQLEEFHLIEEFIENAQAAPTTIIYNESETFIKSLSYFDISNAIQNNKNKFLKFIVDNHLFYLNKNTPVDKLISLTIIYHNDDAFKLFMPYNQLTHEEKCDRFSQFMTRGEFKNFDLAKILFNHETDIYYQGRMINRLVEDFNPGTSNEADALFLWMITKNPNLLSIDCTHMKESIFHSILKKRLSKDFLENIWGAIKNTIAINEKDIKKFITKFIQTEGYNWIVETDSQDKKKRLRAMLYLIYEFCNSKLGRKLLPASVEAINHPFDFAVYDPLTNEAIIITLIKYIDDKNWNSAQFVDRLSTLIRGNKFKSAIVLINHCYMINISKPNQNNYRSLEEDQQSSESIYSRVFKIALQNNEAIYTNLSKSSINEFHKLIQLLLQKQKLEIKEFLSSDRVKNIHPQLIQFLLPLNNKNNDDDFVMITKNVNKAKSNDMEISKEYLDKLIFTAHNDQDILLTEYLVAQHYLNDLNLLNDFWINAINMQPKIKTETIRENKIEKMPEEGCSTASSKASIVEQPFTQHNYLLQLIQTIPLPEPRTTIIMLAKKLAEMNGSTVLDVLSTYTRFQSNNKNKILAIRCIKYLIKNSSTAHDIVTIVNLGMKCISSFLNNKEEIKKINSYIQKFAKVTLLANAKNNHVFLSSLKSPEILNFLQLQRESMPITIYGLFQNAQQQQDQNKKQLTLTKAEQLLSKAFENTKKMKKMIGYK